MPNYFVVLMGIGTVFFGLICIILLCYIMSAICRSMEKNAPAAPAAVSAAPAPVQVPGDRQAMIAAISVAIAEELGTDPAGIRILSVKKI
jgi:sodium pump decarboxylase gamma subunit